MRPDSTKQQRALLVALGVTLLLVNTVKLHRSADATGRSDDYLVAVTNLERSVVDAETGLRGYVITGRSLFLAPTRDAQQGYARAKAALSRAAAADGAFTGEARALESAGDAYMTGYLPRTLNLAAHDLAASRSYAITLAGKQMVDEVRARAAGLERLVSARERTRQDTAKSDASHATLEAILVLVFLTAGTLLLGVFLGYLVLSGERARRRTERTVEVLRQSLLPTLLPSIPGCELAVRFLPAQASELVGGDFYDVFAVSDGRWAIIVGDVCGKGAEAAAITAMARWTLRSRASWSVSPDEALRFLNRAMLGEGLEGRFITVAYLLLTIENGRARVSLACAGHQRFDGHLCNDPEPAAAPQGRYVVLPRVADRIWTPRTEESLRCCVRTPAGRSPTSASMYTCRRRRSSGGLTGSSATAWSWATARSSIRRHSAGTPRPSWTSTARATCPAHRSSGPWKRREASSPPTPWPARPARCCT